MFRKIIQLMTFQVEEEYRTGVESSLYQYRKQIYRVSYVVILLSQLFMMVTMALREGGPFGGSARRAGYFLLYTALAVLSMVFAVLDYWVLQKGEKACRAHQRLEFGYCIVVAAWSCGITLLDQLGGNNLTVFIYMMLMIASVAMLRPVQSIMLFLGTFVVLNLLLPSFPTPDGTNQVFNNLINSFFTTAFSIVISAVFYRNRICSYRDQLVIQKQYEQISAINEQLSREILTDNLTGMKNRRYLQEVVRKDYEDAQAGSGEMACMMADIDFFKQYNDRYGHQAGDRCLIEVAKVIGQCFGEENASAVRYGGEEFFVVLPQCSTDAALRQAEMLRAAMEQRALERDDTPQGCVTLSVGVYTCQAGCGVSFEQFIQQADEALYRAKRLGRNRVEEAC